MPIEKDEDIRRILKNTATIAVVGCSPHAGKPSNMVSAFLQELGYRVIPVNPEYHEILGEKCYPSLRDIPDRIDMVECFRPSGEMAGIAEEAVAIGATVLWMQLGVTCRDAKNIAVKGGLKVVMDRCPRIEIPRLLGDAD